MARRQDHGAGVRVPGLSAAVADRWRELDEMFPGTRFAEWADRVERGEPTGVSAATVFCALVALGDPLQDAYTFRALDPAATFVVAGDVLQEAS